MAEPGLESDLTWPESTWERSVPLPDLDRAFLERHLGPWPELLALEPLRLGGGLRSVVIRLGDVVARIGPEATVAKEEAIHRLVGERVRVAKVVDTRPGVLLLEHVPHEPLPPTPEAGRAAGRSAARIHAFALEEAGMLSPTLEIEEAFPSALDGLRGWAEGLLEGLAGSRLGPAAARVRALWDAHELEMRDVSREPVLTHADYKPVNLKWLPDAGHALGGRVLVLDWEFAWSGAAIFDAGMLMRWDPPEPFVRGFEEGCRDEGAPLPRGWRRMAMLFDLFNLVGFLGQEGERRRRDADLLRRVRETLRVMGEAPKS